MVLEIGRVCVKTAGRDAGKKCVIVQKMDGGFYLIDGQTRRRNVKQTHLEPLKQTVELKEGAENSDVVKALNSIEIECVEKKEKQDKQKSPRPKKQKVKKSEVETKKPTKKSSSKPAQKTEKTKEVKPEKKSKAATKKDDVKEEKSRSDEGEKK